MFKVNPDKIVKRLEKRAKELGANCNRVFVAGSGGVDSTVIITILCRVFGPENTVVMYRNIKSDSKHYEDVLSLQKTLKFKLIYIEATELYEMFLNQCREQFKEAGLEWYEENTIEAEENGWSNAFGSLKSRFQTPMAGFIAKAIDSGRGRIFGTGNAEEDGLLRYFDKFGDGAVDNNIIDGLTKSEVRQLALYFSTEYKSDIFKGIALKTPSADLLACGDDHNDEKELTSWAKNMGYNINISYGTAEKEGNIAWGLKENMDRGVITGENSTLTEKQLMEKFSYNTEQVQVVLFLREIESNTRHKIELPPGLSRQILRMEGLVD